MKISCVVLTHNSGETLAGCLKSVSWCDEIVLIDDCSTDDTRKIAYKYGAKVYSRKLNNNFALQRNFGLSRAKGEWVLFVDSDEVVSNSLAREIGLLLGGDLHKHQGYFVKRRDTWLGKRLVGGESGQTWLLRLGRKKAGRWTRRVHETWKVRGEMGKLRNELDHYPHGTVSRFIAHVNFHASLHARENKEKGKGASLQKVIFYPIGKFFVNFVARGGWRDGAHGFVAAVIMSFHSYLAWAEYYQAQSKK